MGTRMLEWLEANYQWLFSGAGVTLIVLVGGFLFRKAREPANGSTMLDGKSLQAVIDQPSPTVVERAGKPGETTLRPREILKTIGSTPLLQVQDVQKQFEGLRVTWPCRLFAAKKNSDGTIRLHLHHENESVPPLIVLSIDPKKYPGIGLLHKGHKLTVTALINDIDGPFFELSDCDLSYAVNNAT